MRLFLLAAAALTAAALAAFHDPEPGSLVLFGVFGLSGILSPVAPPAVGNPQHGHALVEPLEQQARLADLLGAQVAADGARSRPFLLGFGLPLELEAVGALDEVQDCPRTSRFQVLDEFPGQAPRGVRSVLAFLRRRSRRGREGGRVTGERVRVRG